MGSDTSRMPDEVRPQCAEAGGVRLLGQHAVLSLPEAGELGALFGERTRRSRVPTRGRCKYEGAKRSGAPVQRCEGAKVRDARTQWGQTRLGCQTKSDPACERGRRGGRSDNLAARPNLSLLP